MLDRCWIVGWFVCLLNKDFFVYYLKRKNKDTKITNKIKLKKKKTLKCQPIKNCYLCLLNQTPSLGKIK